MASELALIALTVKDYDEALAFYVGKLGFELLEDSPQSDTKRWVRIRPSGAKFTQILLAKAANDKQLASVGNQTGGRVFLFLHTDNFEEFYQTLLRENIKIIRGPVNEPYGKVLVFEDLYGNLWDLIEPSANPLS